MCRFDRTFRRKVKKLGIKLILYKRYVDDITVILNRICPGWKYCSKSNKMVFHPELEASDMELCDDERTLMILCDIANSISEIKFTFDCPSRNSTGTVPVLDVQMWIAGIK